MKEEAAKFLDKAERTVRVDVKVSVLAALRH